MSKIDKPNKEPAKQTSRSRLAYYGIPRALAREIELIALAEERSRNWVAGKLIREALAARKQRQEGQECPPQQ